jgi:hypothetical protein
LRTLFAVLSLSACGNPITNAIFYEDQAFVTALPDEDFFEAPDLLLASEHTEGDAVAILSGIQAAHELNGYLAPLLASSENVRTIPPNERQEKARMWEGISVIINDDGPTTWLVDAEVNQDGDTMYWTLTGRADEDANPIDFATGWYDPNGPDGAFTIDMELQSEVTGTNPDATGVMEVEFQGTGAERQVELDMGEFDWWGHYADDIFAWADFFSFTDDENYWPCTAFSRSTAMGNRVEGVLHTGVGQLNFDECSNEDMELIWLTGDPGVTVQGAPGTPCAISSFLPDQ